MQCLHMLLVYEEELKGFTLLANQLKFQLYYLECWNCLEKLAEMFLNTLHSEKMFEN